MVVLKGSLDVRTTQPTSGALQSAGSLGRSQGSQLYDGLIMRNDSDGGWMDTNKKELVKRLIREAREFRFCGPSDDPDEQTAVTIGYHHLVVQLQRLAEPVLRKAVASRLKSIEVEFDDLYSVYKASAELDALLPDIESALEVVGPDLKTIDRAQRPTLSALFVNHAADVLAETSRGLTGPEFVRAIGAYAIEFNVEIPHPTYPFEAPNKRTALSENVMAFSEAQRYRIIRDLCDHPSSLSRNPEASRKLKLTLMTRYGHLDTWKLGAEVNEDLVDQTRHWLDTFPEILEVFNQALQKYATRVFVRNLLDDLRLALEKLVQILVGNSKSLENQLGAVGSFVKERGGSPELSNMFVKLVDYYCKYQNTYVKHDDAVIEEEVEFIIEITAAFMKHFVRLAGKDAV